MGEVRGPPRDPECEAQVEGGGKGTFCFFKCLVGSQKSRMSPFIPPKPRKKPGWLFWTTVVLVGVPVLYAGSFGPACWMTSQHAKRLPRLPHRAMVAYWPGIHYARWSGNFAVPIDVSSLVAAESASMDLLEDRR